VRYVLIRKCRFSSVAKYIFRFERLVMFVVSGIKVVGLLSLFQRPCSARGIVCVFICFVFVFAPVLNRELYCSACSSGS
jgi:hypothetical protein